jgi:hypothetical protein
MQWREPTIITARSDENEYPVQPRILPGLGDGAGTLERDPPPKRSATPHWPKWLTDAVPDAIVAGTKIPERPTVRRSRRLAAWRRR